MIERGRIIPTPEETARMLEKAREQMDFSLEGIWNATLIKANYADVVRYQPGISYRVCGELYELASALVRKAQDDHDRESSEYFGRIAAGWARIGFLLQTEQTSVR